MDEYLKRCLEGTELIMGTEQYSLYVNKENKTVHIYNGDDIWEIALNDLGNIGWE